MNSVEVKIFLPQGRIAFSYEPGKGGRSEPTQRYTAHLEDSLERVARKGGPRVAKAGNRRRCGVRNDNGAEKKEQNQRRHCLVLWMVAVVLKINQSKR